MLSVVNNYGAGLALGAVVETLLQHCKAVSTLLYFTPSEFFDIFPSLASSITKAKAEATAKSTHSSINVIHVAQIRMQNMPSKCKELSLQNPLGRAKKFNKNHL